MEDFKGVSKSFGDTRISEVFWPTHAFCRLFCKCLSEILSHHGLDIKSGDPSSLLLLCRKVRKIKTYVDVILKMRNDEVHNRDTFEFHVFLDAAIQIKDLYKSEGVEFPLLSSFIVCLESVRNESDLEKPKGLDELQLISVEFVKNVQIGRPNSYYGDFASFKLAYGSSALKEKEIKLIGGTYDEMKGTFISNKGSSSNIQINGKIVVIPDYRIFEYGNPVRPFYPLPEFQQEQDFRGTFSEFLAYYQPESLMGRMIILDKGERVGKKYKVISFTMGKVGLEGPEGPEESQSKKKEWIKVETTKPFHTA
jgi:hypothetical protein